MLFKDLYSITQTDNGHIKAKVHILVGSDKLMISQKGSAAQPLLIIVKEIITIKEVEEELNCDYVGRFSLSGIDEIPVFRKREKSLLHTDFDDNEKMSEEVD